MYVMKYLNRISFIVRSLGEIISKKKNNSLLALQSEFFTKKLLLPKLKAISLKQLDIFYTSMGVNLQ
jgi:hypothetical protein